MTAEEVAELLRKELLPFTPERVKEVLQRRNLEVEGDLDAFTRAVLEEGVKWTTRALEGLWEGLGDAPSPRGMSTIEKWLSDGGRVRVSHLKTRGYPPKGEEVRVEIRNKNEGLVDVILLHPPRPLPLFKGFSLSAWAGHLEFTSYAGLHVLDDRVFFQEEDGNDLKEVLWIVTNWRSLFSALGLEDVEAALRKLERLKRGEVCTQGAYVLARNENFWLLKKGPILGDPALDRSIFLGEKTTLSFPGGAFSFRASFSEDTLDLEEVSVRWGEETVYFSEALFYGHIFNRNPVVDAIKTGLEREFRKLESGGETPLHEASTRMLAFLRAFVNHEDPLRALADGEFRPYVVAEFFADMF
jgi:hypothetical protein